MADQTPENCTHDCSTCGANCSSRKSPEDLKAHLNEHSSVKKVIGVVSGKGGVGKSLVSSLLASEANRKGLQTAILDADITGPSIPKCFGLKEKAMGTDMGIMPVKSKTGIDIMSVNLMLENDTDPVIWRGPIIAGVVKQFWSEVLWFNEDIMFVDMPPGTGDVPLTVFQSLPLDGIIVVTSPQDLVSMIVAKAVTMAEMMNIPVIGLIENMSYVKCPDCGKKISVFGESHIEEIAKEHNLKVLARLGIDPAIASACDAGDIESIKVEGLAEVIDQLIK